MPENFQLNANDTFVSRYLTQQERAGIQNPQTTNQWTFEFHGGHDTGSPFYIRPLGCTLSSNLAKFDTRTLSGVLLPYNPDNMVNQDVIERKCKMNKAAKDQMYLIVQTNWALLADLKTRYTNGDRQGELEAQRLAQAALQANAAPTTKTCGLIVGGVACTGNVPIVRQGKAMCDTCYQFS